jgi:hypothetical protein
MAGMEECYLSSGRKVVVPDDELEERVVIELMAALAPDSTHRSRLLTRVIHKGNGAFEAYHPDWSTCPTAASP